MKFFRHFLRQERCTIAAAAILASHLLGLCAADEPAATALFADQIAPLLAARCGTCHGPSRAESGYRIDTRAGAFAGGDSGAAAILPNQAEASPLFQRISSADAEGRMPADGPPLAAAEQLLLRQWIETGAVWPGSMAALPDTLFTPAPNPPQSRERHWAFQPLTRPAVPAGPKGTHPIDAFLAEKLSEQGLEFNPEAEPGTFLRRVMFDLVGLPPTPEELATFMEACRTAGGTGEPFSRVVDTLLASPHYGERWARHWLDVVRFAESDGFEVNSARPNAWPYRDWVIESFNADKPYDQFIREQICGDTCGADAATGFLVGGATDRVTSPDPALTANQRADELHDMVSTAGSAFLGMTIGCARCHDHKFDPISQRDYYAIKAVFAGVRHGEREIGGFSDAALTKPMIGYAGTFVDPAPTHRLFRGDPLQPREEVAPGGVAGLGPQWHLPETAPERDRRRALADWITSPHHPLSARVIVNRLWHYHFGTGLVDTPSDLGLNGGRPSHPELLDWLASELIDSGWSLKSLHRLIVTSRAYRQASDLRPEAIAVDAQARLLWRYPPRRLEAEALRDAILAVSGSLNQRMGGPGFDLFEPNTNYVKVYATKTAFTADDFRRMVYQSKPRSELDTFFGPFDCPDAGQVQPKRTSSTTPLQALNLLNGEFLLDQADRCAKRIEGEVGEDRAAQIHRAVLLAFGREASAEEIAAGSRLIAEHGLPSLCRALYNANEFIMLR